MITDEDLNEYLSNLIYWRVHKITRHLKLLGVTDFYIAGGCFGKQINDYDLFPVFPDDAAFSTDTRKEQEPGSEPTYKTHVTANTDTCTFNDGVRIQLCRYHRDSLLDLVDGFDFAHIQVGATMTLDNGSYVAEEVYASDAYIMSGVTGFTSYTGTVNGYPLSSLIRSIKYKERGLFKSPAAFRATFINILNDVLSRGIKSYADFKDQLNSIDLGTMVKAESDAAYQLFRNLYGRTTCVADEKAIIDLWYKGILEDSLNSVEGSNGLLNQAEGDAEGDASNEE